MAHCEEYLLKGTYHILWHCQKVEHGESSVFRDRPELSSTDQDLNFLKVQRCLNEWFWFDTFVCYLKKFRSGLFPSSGIFISMFLAWANCSWTFYLNVDWIFSDLFDKCILQITASQQTEFVYCFYSYPPFRDSSTCPSF